VTLTKAISSGVGLQLALASLLVGALPAQSPAVERLFPAQPTGYVTDAAGIVDAQAKADMESLLARLRTAAGVEIAVVTLPTIGEYDEADVALAIGRKWGVGARAAIGDSTRNAGLVLLVVPRRNHEPGTGHVRIEVGQGLEGTITDATAGTIRREVMGPLLSQEQYSAALVAGVRTLAGIIARAYGVSDSTLTAISPPPSGGGGQPGLPWWFPLLGMVFFIIVANMLNRGRGRGSRVYWGGGPWIGGGWGGGGGFGGGGGGGGGFGGFGGGGGFSGGGSGGRF
jgi:uncharacterized protein